MALREIDRPPEVALCFGPRRTCRRHRLRHLPLIRFRLKSEVRRARGRSFRGLLSSYRSVFGRRLRRRLTVVRRRSCCVRYNVITRKHASLRPEFVVIRIRDVVQQCFVGAVDIEFLTPKYHRPYGPGPHNDDAALRADILPPPSRPAHIHDHRRFFYGKQGIKVTSRIHPVPTLSSVAEIAPFPDRSPILRGISPASGRCFHQQGGKCTTS